MAFFHSFTDSIKQKWLQFFQTNRDWITLHMEVESVYTPDGGKRPSSYLILGVVNALEPKLAQLMLPFSKLNPDADTLVEVLDLHFDPDIVLGNRFIPNTILDSSRDHSPTAISENPKDESNRNHQINSFAAVAVAGELPMENSAAQTPSVGELQAIQNALAEISASGGNNSPAKAEEESSLEADDFGDINFDTTSASERREDEILDDFNSPDENAFREIDDVWGNETALQKGEENNDFLGEGNVFNDSEMARLFPNT